MSFSWNQMLNGQIGNYQSNIFVGDILGYYKDLIYLIIILTSFQASKNTFISNRLNTLTSLESSTCILYASVYTWCSILMCTYIFVVN